MAHGVRQDVVDEGEAEEPAALPFVPYARGLLPCPTAISKTVRGAPSACSVAIGARTGSTSFVRYKRADTVPDLFPQLFCRRLARPARPSA
jgi:hypothetical protein